jgi:hypothetical protein
MLDRFFILLYEIAGLVAASAEAIFIEVTLEVVFRANVAARDYYKNAE